MGIAALCALVTLFACGDANASGLEGLAEAGPVSWTLPARFEEPTPLQVIVSIPGVSAVVVDGQFALAIPGQIPSPRPGAPDVPVLAHLVMGLSDYVARIENAEGDYTEYEEVDVAPSETRRLIGWEDDDRRFLKERIPNAEIYDTAGFWPNELFSVEEAWMGTQKVVRIECRPVQYDPVSKTLRVYREARARIVFEPEPVDSE